jgi:PleD family two-component response regulator
MDCSRADDFLIGYDFEERRREASLWSTATCRSFSTLNASQPKAAPGRRTPKSGLYRGASQVHTEKMFMPRNVFAAVDDMFFASKIRAMAEASGVNVKFYRHIDALLAAAGEVMPDLIIVDLHNQRLDPIDLARKLKTDERLKAVPLLGFFSHVQTELQRQAVEAGYDQVVPRSVFARDLSTILLG